MAAPVFGAAGTFVEGIGDVSPAWPTHATDDIALLIVNSFTGQAAVLGTPAGFVEVTNSPQDSSAGVGGHRTTVFWCRATSGAMSAPTVTDPGSYAIAIILTFTGCITSGDPWDVTSGSNTGATDTTAVAIPGATTTGADRLVVSIVGTGADVQGTAEFSGWTNADLTSVTEILDRTRSISSGGGFGAATGIKAAAGAYGDTTATAANTSGLTYMSIALRADAGASAVDEDSFLRSLPASIRRPVRPWRFFYDEVLAFDAAVVIDDDSRYISFTDLGSLFVARPPVSWFDELLVPEAATVDTPEPPGSTLTAMQAGGISSKWVVAIEGYANLLTDADTSAVITAWTGTGYTAAIGGLFVRPSHSQSINPWQPFENTGGQLTLQVVTDSFGVDTHLKSGGNETQATVSLDCDDNTAITVKSAASFAATGTAYVGTEAISYTGKTGTTLTGLTRGRYSPFLTESNNLFAHPHTITEAIAPSIALLPVVSSTPRSWIGKWVGLWRHLQGPTGLLNVKDDALCTFAGRITEIRDNPATMTTDVEIQHVMEYVRDAVIGENPWKATIEDGITLALTSSGATTTLATAEDFSGATLRTAAPLMVVAGTPASDYEVQAGRYSLTQVKGFLNAWLDQARVDGDLLGTYKFGLTANPDGLTHGKFSYRSTAVGFLSIGLAWTIHRALGTFSGAGGAQFGIQVFSRQITDDNFTYREDSVNGALRSVGEGVNLLDQFGEFFDQSTSAPDGLLNIVPDGLTGSVGVCMLNDTQTVIVTKNGDALESCTAFDPVTGALIPNALDIPWDQPGESKLRQIYILRGTFANIVKALFVSTGTTGFNSTFDTNPAILGLGIPYEILGANFFLSVDRLANADQELTIIIDRPKKLVDVIGACLKLRFAFLRWKSGGLEFFSWMTPTTGDTLEESNKASPESNQDEQRSASLLSDRWARNVIKVDYDKDFSVADTGDAVFHSHLTIIDRAAIDDAGGKKTTETIPDPTSFTSSFLGGSGSLVAVLEHFKSIAGGFFTRPVRTTRRTISPRQFEGLSVGDSVIVTDLFARDPSTGERGVSTRPGIITAHSYEPGGFEPGGGIADMHGEVEVMFLDLLRVGPYVPSADVTSYTGSTITTSPHEYSTSGESADASWMPALHKIRMVERDPADPAAPLSWDRVVSSQTGNDIVLTAALSSPTYDAALFYRVIWDDYPDAVAGQQVYSYQADDADYLIADTRAPYQYTVGTQLKDTQIGDANAASDPVELPPNSSYGDGVGYDVGHMQALNRLANNLYDYKTAISTPVLFQTAIAVSKHPNDEWELAMVMPIFVGADGLTNEVRRKLYVAPMLKSSDGNTVNARITLSKNPPTGDSELDVTFATPFTAVTFTTTSTTYVTATTQGINLGPLKDVFGIVYLTLEIQVPLITTTGSCRGIATAYQGPRE